MSNPQIICGIVKRFLQNRQRVSAESSKGIHGIIKGYPQNRQRVSMDLFKGISAVRIVKASAESHRMLTVESSYCIPRILEGSKGSWLVERVESS